MSPLFIPQTYETEIFGVLANYHATADCTVALYESTLEGIACWIAQRDAVLETLVVCRVAVGMFNNSTIC